MSKTKLAFLVFVLAFGVNIIAFVFSKKAYLIEEVKNVWLYELPPTASPLDSYAAVDLGPQNGVIGTLAHLMEKSDWKPNQLTIDLKPGLTFSNHDPILPANWVQSREWALPYLQQWGKDPYWSAYLTASMDWKSPTQVQFSWKDLPKNFDAETFIKKTLSHPMTGVLHPNNLTALRLNQALQDKKLTKEWISSGSYRVRKWNPKEIVLISRDDFPVMMPKEFFRTLKYQSAPVKNPSCEFMQAQPGEEKAYEEHRVNLVDQSLHLFWICRSWKEPGSFCSNAQNREKFSKLMAGKTEDSTLSLASQKLRYRIPFGSDAFREDVIQKIKKVMKDSGGSVEEISYFFKPSTDADVELLLVVTDAAITSDIAEKMAVFSSRLTSNDSEIPQNIVGEFSKYPVQILMKNMKGDAFKKVFLEPDLEEKKIPL